MGGGVGGKEWGLSSPQQTAQRAAAGARNCLERLFSERRETADLLADGLPLR